MQKSWARTCDMMWRIADWKEMIKKGLTDRSLKITHSRGIAELPWKMIIS